MREVVFLIIFVLICYDDGSSSKFMSAAAAGISQCTFLSTMGILSVRMNFFLFLYEIMNVWVSRM